MEQHRGFVLCDHERHVWKALTWLLFSYTGEGCFQRSTSVDKTALCLAIPAQTVAVWYLESIQAPRPRASPFSHVVPERIILWLFSTFALSCLPFRGLRMRTHPGGVVSSPAWVCPSPRPSVALPRLLCVWTGVECSRARPQTSLSTSWGWQGSAQTSWGQSGASLHSSPCSCLNSPTKLCLGMSTFRWNAHPAQQWETWKMSFSFFHNQKTVSDTFLFFCLML